MTRAEKSLLRELVVEIEHSKAMLGLLAAHVGTGVSLAVAGEAMKQALKDNQPRFDELRKQVEAL
jgi:hypothetical protein